MRGTKVLERALHYSLKGERVYVIAGRYGYVEPMKRRLLSFATTESAIAAANRVVFYALPGAGARLKAIRGHCLFFDRNVKKHADFDQYLELRESMNKAKLHN
jgi:hypothetical protein